MQASQPPGGDRAGGRRRARAKGPVVWAVAGVALLGGASLLAKGTALRPGGPVPAPAAAAAAAAGAGAGPGPAAAEEDWEWELDQGLAEQEAALERRAARQQQQQQQQASSSASPSTGGGGEEGAAASAAHRGGEAPAVVRDEAISTSAGGIESPYQAPLPAGGYPPKPRGSPKGDAKKELLFDLECPEPPPAAVKELRCLGTGPLGRSKQCPANAADVGQIGVPPLEASPSGCREAYMTTMGDDGFLPAVLVLIHTLRKHTQVARDIVVYASTAVSAEAVALLLAECVRVVVIDPFAQNQRASALIAKSERYASGYWVLKMFFWRAEEYDRAVFLDGDIYVRHNPESLFCVPLSEARPIGVTPRSSQNPAAGFNAGMFAFRPAERYFDLIMDRFQAQTEEEMLATSEQDFLNAIFKGKYVIVPLDFIAKHRRVINKPAAWDYGRIKGFHMNGNPKPWAPTWTIACAYPGGHGKKVKAYVEFFKEWWAYYYEYVGAAVPADVGEYRLRPAHDRHKKLRWEGFSAAAYKCPDNPNLFSKEYLAKKKAAEQRPRRRR